MSFSDLLKKYDIPVPRYTSYPTVPYWNETPTESFWIESIDKSLKDESATWALYIHIPFCETLCTFCGCNNTITKNHKLENPYVARLIREMQTYIEKVPVLKRRHIKQIHLGGGTPTFLSTEELTRLLTAILQMIPHDDFEGSIEVDPRRTTVEQLKALYQLGFRRVSMGVQDFNPEVQKIVNRFQPFEVTKKLTDEARAMGYQSVNFDLIYGLPLQTEDLIKKTVEMTIALKPDRIALYSFAMVPWIKPQQRLFKDEDVPQGEEKRKLYEIAKQMLVEAGYKEIGMDHFALATDSMWKSYESGKIHRNFMGYADLRTDVLLGLGVSSISETKDCFHQNEKILAKYEELIDQGKLATHRGHVLNDEDKTHREQILQLMTKWNVKLYSPEQESDLKNYLAEMIKDNLVEITNGTLKVKEEGKPFLRNACLGFDKRYRRQEPGKMIFSRSI